MDSRLPGETYLICVVAHTRIAISLSNVERVEPAVEITPLKGAPDAVLGVIDYHGEIQPVYSVSERLGLEQRPIRSSGKLVMVRTPERFVSLSVDDIQAIGSIDEEIGAIQDDFAAKELGFLGLARTEDGLVVVLDLDRFLKASDRSRLNELLAAFGQEA